MQTLGDRIKAYERCYGFSIPDKSQVIIRVDGRAFSSLTSGLQKPFDSFFVEVMDEVHAFLGKEIQGAKAAYTQSDECSIWLNNCDSIETQAWFGNKLQKLCSMSASLATAKFNQNSPFEDQLATFDSRVFVVPNIEEVANYFLWRIRDCKKNAISAIALKQFGPSKIMGKSTVDREEMIGDSIRKFSKRERFGRFSVRGVDLPETPQTFEKLFSVLA